MKFVQITCCFLALFMLASCGNKEEEMTDFIPRKILFGNPDRIAVKVSPDGKYISYVAPLEGVLNIFVAPVNNLSKAEAVTFDKGRGIRSYDWLVSSEELIYGQDTDGDENTILYHVNLTEKNVTQITKKGVLSKLVKVSKKHPDEVLFVQNERNKSYFDIVKFNSKTKSQDLIYENNEYAGFILDEDLGMRFSSKNLPNGDIQIDEYLDGKMSPFKTIKFDDMETSGPYSLNAAGDKLFMLDSSGADKAKLYSIDLQTKQSSLIGGNDKADISGVILHPETMEVQAYSYEYDITKIDVVDSAIKEDIDYLTKLSTGDLNIVSRSLDDKVWIVGYDNDDKPFSYYKYDKDAKQAEFLFTHNAELAKYKLNKMHPLIIKARDGLEMVSYLTLPAGIELDGAFKASQPKPMVLYVHGGPVARDSFGYNPVHQWLSNRGYAVLSVNYRASSGFGKEFIRKGDGEWSGKMHNDLLDAVSWAINNGITEKDKVAIFGGSYGGYATLVGLTMTPDIFACGVDIVGPSNLKTLYDSIPPYWEPYIMALRRRFGLSLETKDLDLNLLARVSPITYVDHIKKPILIAQGANDPRVKQAESEQIVEKMKEKKIPYTYLLYKNEGHGFARPENKASFYANAEEFLARVFGKKFEPVGDDGTNSSVVIEKQ
jgi:dipeptidyl aminopeptidase/acylaminoacyl peptidase